MWASSARQSGGKSSGTSCHPSTAGRAGAGSGRRDPGRRGAAQFIRRSEGVGDALPSGVLAGYPAVDVKVALTFGCHGVDSNERLQDGRLMGCLQVAPR